MWPVDRIVMLAHRVQYASANGDTTFAEGELVRAAAGKVLRS
jgi:hypothetical protein